MTGLPLKASIGEPVSSFPFSFKTLAEIVFVPSADSALAEKTGIAKIAEMPIAMSATAEKIKLENLIDFILSPLNLFNYLSLA